MSTQELKARARRLVEEVFSQADLTVADELVSPDYAHHVPGDQPAPGLTGLKEWVNLMHRAFRTSTLSSRTRSPKATGSYSA